MILKARFRKAINGFVFYNIEAERVGSGSYYAQYDLSLLAAYNMIPARYLTTGDSASSVIRAGLGGVIMREYLDQADAVPVSIGEKVLGYFLGVYVVEPWKTVAQGCYPTSDAFI
jgi:hypothetical protein